MAKKRDYTPMKHNKYALGNTGGRPPKYKDSTELDEKCKEYFEKCIESKDCPSIFGLTLFLGFCDSNALKDYEEKSDEFSRIIKRAKTVIKLAYELRGNTMDIFLLKVMGVFESNTDLGKTFKVQVIEE